MKENYGKIQQIETNKVAFDTNNPRGESEDEILRDPSFTQLVESVGEFGVLVPIVVCKQKSREKPFRLIDGERRLRAALRTKTQSVPAHIVEQASSYSMKQAFHIHMLRKEWSNTAQVRALKKMIAEIEKGKPKLTHAEMLTELRAETGYTNTQLITYMRGEKYDESVLSDVDSKRLSWSHLVQIEESFIEQLKIHYPQIIKDLGETEIRSKLVSKAKRRILKTRSLMENIVPLIAMAQEEDEKKHAEQLLRVFINEQDVTAEQVHKQYQKQHPQSAKQTLDVVDTIIDDLDNLAIHLSGLDTFALAAYDEKAREIGDKIEHVLGLLATISKKLKG